MTQDPLKKLYKPLGPVQYEKEKTALLCVDMQYLDAARGYGAFANAKELGVEEHLEYYFNRIEKTVIPNIVHLQEAFRAKGLEVIHTKIESLTKDGRDRSPEHKRIGIHAAKGSKDAEILEEVKPVGDEIVIPKTASGVFNSTNIEYVLRNLEIKYLIIVGVVTNECVETAVRDASDRGFEVTVIEDACAAVTEDLHHGALRAMQHTYARVRSTEEVVQDIENL